MNQRNILGAGLLVVGLILLWFGLRATDSVGESIQEGLTGKYSDKTTLFVVSGALLTIVGGGLAFFGSRSSRA